MCSNEDAITDLASTDFGELEREWLYLVRLLCMSYEHNQADGLDRALSHAEQRFGLDEGPEIASRIAVLIRAMRAERQGGFGYLSPFCPNCRLNVTADEWALITLMRAGYRGASQDVQAAAARFARRPAAPVLAAAATRFGASAAAASIPRRAQSPAGATLH